MKYEQLKSFLQSFKSTYAGIQSVSDSMSENKEFGYSASTSVRGGIPVVGGSISGGVNGGMVVQNLLELIQTNLHLRDYRLVKLQQRNGIKTLLHRRLLEDSIKEAIKEIDIRLGHLKSSTLMTVL